MVWHILSVCVSINCLLIVCPPLGYHSDLHGVPMAQMNSHTVLLQKCLLEHGACYGGQPCKIPTGILD